MPPTPGTGRYLMTRLSEFTIRRVNVFIADADLMSAQLLAGELARGKQDINVVGVSNDSAEAIRELEKRQPDIALINTHLQDGKMTGYRVLQSLPTACPKTAVGDSNINHKMTETDRALLCRPIKLFRNVTI